VNKCAGIFKKFLFSKNTVGGGYASRRFRLNMNFVDQQMTSLACIIMRKLARRGQRVKEERSVYFSLAEAHKISVL
jgi:hypothetical protein